MSEPEIVVARQLKDYVRQIERARAKWDAARDETNQILDEAAGAGFHKGALRDLVGRRRKDPEKLRERDTVRALYEEALKVR